MEQEKRQRSLLEKELAQQRELFDKEFSQCGKSLKRELIKQKDHLESHFGYPGRAWY
jgi:hypothetical protein